MTTLTRRAFTGAFASGALSAPAVLGSMTAASAQTQTPAPGPALNGASFYRFALGEKTVTVLADGSDLFPGASLFAVNADPQTFRETQARLARPSDTTIFSMNTLLVEEGGRRILIDAGTGAFFGPRFGRQARALANAGVAPDSIDTVIITHGHPDHFGGLLTEDGALAFRNAQVIWNEDEYRFWSSEEAKAALRGSKIPPAFVDGFIAATEAVLPAVRQQSAFVRGEREVAPGVTILPAPGHTPHSQVVLITSGGESLLAASDTLLLPLQNAIHPEWISAFELDGAGLVDTRRRLLDRAAADDIVWHGYHASFPALGRIRAEGGAYRFLPEAWQW